MNWSARETGAESRPRHRVIHPGQQRQKVSVMIIDRAIASNLPIKSQEGTLLTFEHGPFLGCCALRCDCLLRAGLVSSGEARPGE